jgi:hypothetical protein
VFAEYPELEQRIPGTFLGNDLIQAVAYANTLGDQIERERRINTSPLHRQPTHLAKMVAGS